MKEGDKVKTHMGEYGYILRPCPKYMIYHWWVEIHFTIGGEERTSIEPYNKRELEVIQ